MDSVDVNELGQRRLVRRDAVIVVCITVLVGILCVSFDASEALFHWSRRIEELQLDELPMVLLTLTICLLWFAIRRYREGNEMLKRQLLTDARLSVALNENRQLAQQHLNALESERKHLARELHDELGQYLNAIKLDAVAIRQSLLGDGELRKSAVSIERNADHVYSVVAELIRQLRPVGLDELGLVTAVENLLDSWRQRLPALRIDFVTEGDFDGLSEQASLTAFRVAQEGVTNVAKHSHATKVIVHLRRLISAGGASSVVVKIEDDGVGIDLSQPRDGFGLAGMRERVEMQGGRFDVQSSPSQGFFLSASFPA